jgi:hypothetical protein
MKRIFKWEWPSSASNIQPAVLKFKHYLQDNGFRASVIEGYTFRVKNYLQFAGTSRPNQDTLNEFRQVLHARGLKRSTINGYSIAIKAYHKMYGEEVTYKFLKVSDQIPYFFNEADVHQNIQLNQELQALYYANCPFLWSFARERTMLIEHR